MFGGCVLFMCYVRSSMIKAVIVIEVLRHNDSELLFYLQPYLKPV